MSSQTGGEGKIYEIEKELEPKPIEELELQNFEWKPFLVFAIALVIGIGFFLFPVSSNGRTTVPFDIVVSYITGNFGSAVGL